MIWLVSVALADPTMCDPKRDTAAAAADGYCVDATTYAELGRLRVEAQALKSTVAARDAEILAFEEWKATRDAEFAATLGVVREAALQDKLELQAARKRTFLERDGVAVGVVLGSVSTIVITCFALYSYGIALDVT